MTTDYKQGFRDGVEQAAHKICMACQQSYPLEERERIALDGSREVYLVHQRPDRRWNPCSASEIRALTPRFWRNFLLSPETMAAMFHESYLRFAPKFGYRTREDRQTAETQVNRYRNALKHIATHTTDPETRDDALKVLAEGERFPIWEPAEWERATDTNRLVTIAVCAEILGKLGSKTA